MDADFWKEAAAYLGAGMIAMLTALGKLLWNRVDTKADKDDLDELIVELRQDRKAASESRARLYERVNTMAQSLARLEGRLGRE